MAKTYASINSAISQLIGEHNQLVNKVGDLADLTTAEDSDLVAAINDVNSQYVGLQAQINSDGTAIQILKNTTVSLQTQIDSDGTAIQTLKTTASSLQSQINSDGGDIIILKGNIITLNSGKQAADSTLSAFAAYNTNGLITQTGVDTFTGRTITGTANQVNVSNGSGISGNPTISLEVASDSDVIVGIDNTKIITPAKLSVHKNAELLGWNQTSQIPARVAGVIYQNTTGRPIFLSIRAQNTTALQTLGIGTDGFSFNTVGSFGSVADWLYAVIPNNYYYQVTQNVGTTIILNWAELR